MFLFACMFLIDECKFSIRAKIVRLLACAILAVYVLDCFIFCTLAELDFVKRSIKKHLEVPGK